MFLYLILQLIVLVAAVAIRDPGSNSTFTCGTPLPVFDNGTRANSWDEYFFEIERTEPNSNGGQGVTDAWGNDGGPILWPRNNENKVVIPYCFMDHNDRRNVRNVVENGMANWIK
jgi:hypothetical protein